MAGRVAELRAAIHSQTQRRPADSRWHCKNPLSPTAASTARKPHPKAESPSVQAVSTSPNPTQEGTHHLKLTTQREELVSKLSVVSRAISNRAATQSLSGILLNGLRGWRVTLAATDLEMGLRTDLRRRGRERGLGSAARPPVRRSLALARRGERRDRVARGRARRGDPQRRLELSPAGSAGRGLPEVSRAAGRAADDPRRRPCVDRRSWSPAPPRATTCARC